MIGWFRMQGVEFLCNNFNEYNLVGVVQDVGIAM